MTVKVRDGAWSAATPPAASPVLASMRQIGFEVIQTLRQQRDVIQATLN